MATLHTANGLALREFMTEILFPVDESGEKDSPEVRADNKVHSRNAMINYKGASSDAILYLLNDERNEFFSPAANDAFLKTIAALGLSPEKLTLVNLANNGTLDLDRLQERFTPTKMVFSGVRPELLGLAPVNLHEPWTAGSLPSLATYSFEELLNESEKKKQFWTALKKFLS